MPVHLGHSTKANLESSETYFMYRFYYHFNNLDCINSQRTTFIVRLKHAVISFVSSEIVTCRWLK